MADNQENGRDVRCDICNPEDSNEGGALHTRSEIHKFNFALWEWSKGRRRIVNDRDGITLEIRPVPNNSNIPLRYEYNKRRGKHSLHVTSEEFKSVYKNVLEFEVIVTNISNNNIILYSGQLLHPYPLFELIDEHLNNTRVLDLAAKATYRFKIGFSNKQVTSGCIKIPLSLNFFPANNKNKQFTIARCIAIVFDSLEEKTHNEKSPFTGHEWDMKQVKIDRDPSLRGFHNYEFPKDAKRLIYAALQEFGSITVAERDLLNLIKMKMEPGHVTAKNYRDYFHYLLWMDEAAQELGLRQYNMENVFVEVSGDFLELEVSGLAEKRPSVVVGDRILIRVHDDHQAYMGLIKYVRDSTVIIDKIEKSFLKYLKNNPTELDVSFILGRLIYERMHEAIDAVCDKRIVENLFPAVNPLQNYRRNLIATHNNEFVNQCLIDNPEQKMAVINIINNSSLKAPFIVFGPPGTGKTATIIEAILQIKKRTNKRILICAPANSTCDMIAIKLTKFCTKSELIRINSDNREMGTVTEELKGYCNEFGVKVSGAHLMSKRIVVSTLILIGKYARQYHPDYVFIDEAGQALEPEADIAIGLSAKAQIILAGDPKQLGPICASRAAAKAGLELSLLKRLMINFEVYNNSNPDPNYITMLKLNYRSHEEILDIPNRLFYNSELKAVSNNVLFDPIANINLYPLIKNHKRPAKKGFPTEFCCVMAKEKREGRSPSYYNIPEIEQVLKYIKMLLQLDLGEEWTVLPNQIGVIAPYIRQVYKILEKLRHNSIEGVEVGTTETFQGREKRIMIISTVRAQNSLLLYDRKYNLGFVRQENRFNVALTRAKSKLIVVGCPFVLGTDEKWLEYIKKCETNNSYYGPPYQRRSKNVRDAIIRGMSNSRNT